MPDFVPATIVKVLKDVPLDSTYSDTIKFTSLAAQTAFFTGKAKYSFTDFTYQRVNSSVAQPRGPRSVRVPRVADDLYDCNYLMFQNSNYGTKWFYAFIKQVNYINPNNTEIIYELDHYQTWAFDFNVLPSIVEREHPNSDGLYENLVPEPMNEANMYTQSITELDLQTEAAKIVVGVSTDPNDVTVAGSLQGGVYSGVELHEFDDAESATAFIRSYDNKAKAEAIVCVYMSAWPVNYNDFKNQNITRPSNLNGYIPRNNKLLTYPYCKITMSNRQGTEYDFYYEYFTHIEDGKLVPATITFNYLTYGGVQPKGYCVAVDYNGIQGSVNMDYNSVGEVDGFVQCAWTSNVFANWLAGEGMSQAFKIGTNAMATSYKTGTTGGINALTSALSGNVSGVANAVTSTTTGTINNLINTAHSAADLAIDAWTRSKCPGLNKGTPHAANLNMIWKNIGFTIKQMAILPEIAATIDDYFDMYGYATNRMKVPNMTGRESWNYVKTNNVIISGSVPVDSMTVIKNMFNNGVRFWHGDFVGDYSRSNRPLSEVQNNA